MTPLVDDFCFMRQGIVQKPLLAQDAQLLAPIDRRGSGNQRALLLLHGFSSSPAVYRELLPHLTMYDAVRCPLLPGHGESLQAFAKATSSQWQAAAEQSCADLVQNYREVDVLGLSLGGLLACWLSQRFPIRRLYLLAPAMALKLPIRSTLFLTRLLQGLGLRSIANRSGNLRSKTHQELTYRRLPLSSIVEVLQIIQALKNIRPSCPTEIFLARFDPVVDSKGLEQIWQDLPNARVHWLNQSSHLIPLDNDRDAIVQCLEVSYTPL